ncbi:MAG: type II toxin-antitoxin system Phd/YefM family antitoxin [Actinomycetota bacterium]
MERIGVRELRQHASRYLARVERGESLTVTDRGRPVARLIPVLEDRWADLIASGKVIAARAGSDLLTEAPGNYPVNASEVLASIRAEER